MAEKTEARVAHPASDIAFTPAVKAVQERKGSRPVFARMESGEGWETRITDDLKAFIEAQTSAVLATASAQGQPYVQHRGGPPGFLRVVDERTIAFVDFIGNRQYITQGNLAENPRAHLLLIDYARRQRVKLWGEASVIEDDRQWTARLMPNAYKARPSAVVTFAVHAWDANCPQHIPQRFEAEAVAEALAGRDARIAELEAELQRLRES
jgi:predicted pyridoxine 5'-phosphate oxidase superfamily flavin-nucleotide-binding protein